MEKQKFSGWRVFVGCVLFVFVVMGSAASIGITMSAMVVEWQLTATQVNLIVTISSLSIAVLTAVSGMLAKKMSFKVSFIIGTCCVALYHVLYAVSPSITVVYLATPISGLFFGFASIPTLSALVARWFIRHRGLLLGITIGASAVGNTLFTWVSGRLVDTIGWRQGCIVFAVLQLVVGFVCIIFLMAEPEKLGQKPLGWEEAEENAVNTSAQEAGAAASGTNTLADVVPVKTASFWMLCMAILLLSAPAVALLSLMAVVWGTGGLDPVTGANYLTLLTAIGAVMTFAGGVINDKLGNRRTTLLYTVALIIAMALHVIMAGSGSYLSPLLVPAIIFFGISGPIRQVLGPNFAGTFGEHNYRQVVLFFQVAVTVGSAVLPLVFGAMADNAGSYLPAFVVTIVCAVVGYILLVLGDSTSPLAKLQRASKAVKQ